jgi:transposase
VERAFRSLKSIDLKIRPIHHRLADRVKAHVFLFQTLLSDLATIARNTVTVKRKDEEPVKFEKVTQPTPLQQRAIDLLGVGLIV